jgi:ABC-type multidrug transport system fused ATPase/permease subunit
VGLELRAGEQVAVVGEVGAGKTTLVRALAGIVAPQEGVVRLNGKPLMSLDGPEVRRAIGLVPQEPVLFTATIRENVLLGREGDDTRIWRALDLAGLANEVRALPDGLDHQLGLRGRGLSGGQRQRLTIARALYGDPQLLLLDDITAALDAENEDRFWEQVAQELPDATILVVTHRAATAKRMERALTLDAGQLASVSTG